MPKRCTRYFVALCLVFSGCAKEIKVCPIDVPRMYRRAPHGDVAYLTLINEPVVFDCFGKTCKILWEDFVVIVRNVATCENARRGLVEYFDVLRDGK